MPELVVAAQQALVLARLVRARVQVQAPPERVLPVQVRLVLLARREPRLVLRPVALASRVPSLVLRLLPVRPLRRPRVAATARDRPILRVRKAASAAFFVSGGVDPINLESMLPAL